MSVIQSWGYNMDTLLVVTLFHGKHTVTWTILSCWLKVDNVILDFCTIFNKQNGLTISLCNKMQSITLKISHSD
jgi:hypothetical protein